jgi:hypothetical protein
MHTAEWLMLAQTLILFLTGLVVVWYAWETHQLRQTSSRQAELMQQQLASMQESLRRDIQEELRKSRPFFRWFGGLGSPTTLEREFRNEGGAISRLSIHTPPPLRASITPKDMLQTNERGTVSFESPRAPLPDPFEFEIHYRTQLDQDQRMYFRVENDTPREVEEV